MPNKPEAKLAKKTSLKREDLPKPPKNFDRVAGKLEKRTVTPRSEYMKNKKKSGQKKGPGY